MTTSFFILGGLVFGFTINRVEPRFFDMDHFGTSIISACVNFGVIWYVNQVVPLNFGLSTLIDEQTFAVLVAVAEECFFRMGILLLVYRLTDSPTMAIVTSSAIWAGYHVAKYGRGDPTTMPVECAIVFVCGLILGKTLLWTRSIDGSVFGHALVNYVAYL